MNRFVTDRLVVKRFYCLAVFLIAAIGLLSPAVHAKNWYEGGTLQGSKTSTWSASTAQNKRATAADWVLKSDLVLAAVRKSGDINETKKYAEELVACIDTAIGTGDVPSQTSEIAASCMVSMGWFE